MKPSPRSAEPAASLLTTDPVVVAERLAAGGLAALPTETVYGLAADVADEGGIGRIFEIKGRPRDHPLIVHFDSPQPERWIEDGWVAEGPSNGALHELASAFWPGPLTVIVGSGPRMSPTVTGGRKTVGIRVPAHEATQRTLGLLERPVAAPSANRFGRVSPTSALHVIEDIGTLLRPGIDAILDGGPSELGVESTIVELTATRPQVLRHGAVTEAALGDVIGTLDEAAGPARASGMLPAHYAPSGFVVLTEDRDRANLTAETLAAEGHAVEIIDRSDDPTDAARRLYADLRRADRDDVDGLVFVMPPAVGIGIAVRDRLRRAATGSAPPNPVR